MTFSILETILASIASIFGTLYVTKAKSNDKHIVQQRQDWRELLRNYIHELSEIDFSTSITSKLLDVRMIRNKFYVRINPYRDKPIIDEFDKLIRNMQKHNKNTTAECIGSVNKITQMTSKLLKHDWDRIKSDQSIIGSPYLIGRIFNILVLISTSSLIVSLLVNTWSINENIVIKDWIFLEDFRLMFFIFIVALVTRIIFSALVHGFFFRTHKCINPNIFSKKFESKINTKIKNDMK